MAPSDLLTKMSKIFKAFGDPTRLKMIRLLASNMEEKLCVIDIAKKLGISQPAVSQHIKVLKNIDILFSSKEARPRIYYYLDVVELKKQKKMVDQLFQLAFTRCEQGGQCQECPFRDSCEDVKI